MISKKTIFLIIITLTLGAFGGYGLRMVLAGQSAGVVVDKGGVGKQADSTFQIDTSSVEQRGVAPATSYADELNKAIPSVVSVYTVRVVSVLQYERYNPMDDLFRRFFGIPSPNLPRRSVPQDEIEERKLPAGVGSGVIVSKDGYILTNHHVITDRQGNSVDEILIKLNDGRELKAEIVGSDDKTDIAVLKVDAKDLPLITMGDSDQLRVGDLVFAIGNPMGVGQTVTMGIVSATGRSKLGLLGDRTYEYFIQTDASINPGNSGGALVDAKGRLIGINTAIISQTGGNIGIGFAIPVNIARNIMGTLIDKGVVKRGFLGINISDLNADMAEAFGIVSAQGALVQEVEKGLPADIAGIKRGDIIISVGDKLIKDANDLRITISQILPDTKVRLKVLRDGKERQFDIKLSDLDDPYGTGIGLTEFLLEGVTVTPLNKTLRSEYQIEIDVNGLLVTEIKSDSPYFRGLREGMVIIEINDQQTKNIQGARQALRKGMNKLWVYERGRYGYLAIRI